MRLEDIRIARVRVSIELPTETIKHYHEETVTVTLGDILVDSVVYKPVDRLYLAVNKARDTVFSKLTKNEEQE